MTEQGASHRPLRQDLLLCTVARSRAQAMAVRTGAAADGDEPDASRRARPLRRARVAGRARADHGRASNGGGVRHRRISGRRARRLCDRARHRRAAPECEPSRVRFVQSMKFLVRTRAVKVEGPRARDGARHAGGARVARIAGAADRGPGDRAGVGGRGRHVAGAGDLCNGATHAHAHICVQGMREGASHKQTTATYGCRSGTVPASRTWRGTRAAGCPGSRRCRCPWQTCR